MAVTKDLRDLHVTGRPERIGDGDSVVYLYVKKLNKMDMQRAVRKAGAARARHLAVLSDEDSDEYLDIWQQVHDLDRDTVTTYVIGEELAKARQSAEAELELGEDADGETTEWGKDGYLQGLLDSWRGDETTDGLEAVYAEDPEDTEAIRVFAELTRFADKVDELVAAQEADIRARHEDVPLDELRRRAVKTFAESKANGAWLDEFEKARLWLGVRRPCEECTVVADESRSEQHGGAHPERFFETRAEVDELEDETLGQLVDAYHAVSVDVTEGKDSEPTPDSLLSSEPSDTAETEQPSGPPTAGA